MFNVIALKYALFDKVLVPDTFNDYMHVLLDNVVVSDTFNDDLHDVLFDNGVNPYTFNDVINVVLNVVFVHIALSNTAVNLEDPSVDVHSNLPVGFIEASGFVVF